jgi:hypothetical protein
LSPEIVGGVIHVVLIVAAVIVLVVAIINRNHMRQSRKTAPDPEPLDK